MGKYQVIYADPPWAYRVWSKKGNGRSAESHYPTMSIEEIADLPVNELADENCALFLWVTFPLLKEIWKVIDAWGFTYKSVAFVWIKQNKKQILCFGVWGTGQEPMQRFVFLQQKEVQNVIPNVCIRLL